MENQFYWDPFVFVFNIVATVAVNYSNFYLLGTPKSFAGGLFSLDMEDSPIGDINVCSSIGSFSEVVGTRGRIAAVAGHVLPIWQASIRKTNISAETSS